MSKIIYILLLISVLSAIINGKMTEISNSFLSQCADAVTLVLSLTGSMCLWSGVMRVASDSGVIDFLARIMRPIIGLLFPTADKNGKAYGYIVMNLLSNFLGLGNASTPIGIKAMQELNKEQPSNGVASDNMIMLAVINTAGLQLFPATVAAVRTNYASASPADIVPAVWLTSIYCFVLSVGLAKAFGYFARLRSGIKK